MVRPSRRMNWIAQPSLSLRVGTLPFDNVIPTDRPPLAMKAPRGWWAAISIRRFGAAPWFHATAHMLAGDIRIPPRAPPQQALVAAATAPRVRSRLTIRTITQRQNKGRNLEHSIARACVYGSLKTAGPSSSPHPYDQADGCCWLSAKRECLLRLHAAGPCVEENSPFLVTRLRPQTGRRSVLVSRPDRSARTRFPRRKASRFFQRRTSRVTSASS